MSDASYPPGMSRADYDHVEGNDHGYEEWFEENEQDLIDAFFEAWEETPEESPKRWERFVEAEWDRHVDSLRGQVDDNRD